MSKIGNFFRRLSGQPSESQEQEAGLNDTPAMETPLSPSEKVPAEDKKENTKLLSEYFLKFPYIKKSTGRSYFYKSKEYDALTRHNDVEDLLMYERKMIGGSDQEIIERLVDDYADVQEQYFQLVSILPKNLRRLLPPFRKEEWGTLDFEKAMENNPFIDENSAHLFLNRAEGLSAIAFQIDSVISVLSVKEAADKAKKVAA